MKRLAIFNFNNGKAMKMMRLVLALGALVLAFEGQGQGWLKTYGGEGNHAFVKQLMHTPEGNYLILCQLRTPNNFVVDSTVLIKTNTFGEIIWIKNYIDGWTMEGEDMVALPGGHYAISGQGVESETIVLSKLDELGNQEWTVSHDLFPDGLEWGLQLISTSDGKFVVSGLGDAPDFPTSYLSKINENGELVWFKKYPNTLSGNGNNYFRDVFETPGNSLLVAGYETSPPKATLFKIADNGSILWHINPDLSANSSVANKAFSLEDETYLVIGSSGTEFFISKVDTLGNIVSQNSWSFSGKILQFKNAIITTESELLITGIIRSPFEEYDVFLLKLDIEGNEIWYRQFGTVDKDEYSTNLLQNTDKSILIGGYVSPANNDTQNDVFLIKTDSLGILFSSALTGSVHLDPQSDCLPDPTEPALANWLVQAAGNYSFATLTDAGGHFTLPVDTGSYQVTVTPPGPYWEVCNSPASVTISAFYDTLALDFPVQADEECPYLEVDISAPFLRRCFDNTYAVHYCNYGTVTAEDASVEVTLDPYLTYQSSTRPFST